MIKQTKIVMIGAGSYVFSVGLIYDLIVEEKLNEVKLVLMDTNEELAHQMAEIARRMAKEVGSSLYIESTTNRKEALLNADYVTCSAAVQLHKRYEMDRIVLSKYGIREISSECGGVGGISYALRSIALVLDIAKDMEHLCPNAILFNVTNPLPRVIAALSKYTKITSFGFCNVANGGLAGKYSQVGRLLNRNTEDLEVISAGLNHFTWLLSVKDKRTGEDLITEVNKHISNGSWAHKPLSLKLWEQTGYWPLAGDTHTGEFIPFNPQMSKEHFAHHGNAKERAERLEMIRAAAVGEIDWRSLLSHRAWEHPGLVIGSLINNKSIHLDMINLVNNRYIDNLPDGAIVEVPAITADGHIIGKSIGPLPDSIAQLCLPVSNVHTLVADAAATGNLTILDEAIHIDPSITNKNLALSAIHELINIHSDVLPQFNKEI